jgi:hypothetical protein
MCLGQPGRLVQIEERVERHERGMQRIKGFFAAASAVLTVLHVAIDYICR